ncbi:hypothetical protein [Novipirellula caenicola]|uniref:Uncharacterized protein n=1 Tax=Novipirellula caenicola TaxID=1536901 RepID=A0ABP9VT77_9BACT
MSERETSKQQANSMDHDHYRFGKGLLVHVADPLSAHALVNLNRKRDGRGRRSGAL